MNALLKLFRRLVVLAILAAIPSSLFLPAMAADDSIDLTPRWKQGEKVRYQMVKGRSPTRDGKVDEKNNSRTDLEIEILKANQDGFVVGWTMGETRLGDPKGANDPFAKRFVNLVKGFQIVMELDSEASIRGVRNGRELKATMDKAMGITMELLEAEGLDKDLIAKLKQGVGPMFATQEQVEGAFLREPQMFFAAVGRSYRQGAPIEYDDELSNPFGGAPLPANGQFLLKAVDKKTGLATIGWKQSIDQRAAKPILEKTLKQFAERMGKKDAPAPHLDSLAVDDEAEFSIEIASGWPQSLSLTRTIRVGAKPSQEILQITRSPSGPQ